MGICCFFFKLNRMIIYVLVCVSPLWEDDQFWDFSLGVNSVELSSKSAASKKLKMAASKCDHQCSRPSCIVLSALLLCGVVFLMCNYTDSLFHTFLKNRPFCFVEVPFGKILLCRFPKIVSTEMPRNHVQEYWILYKSICILSI